MAINLESLAPLTTAAQSLSNLVLVTPESTQGMAPQNPANPDGTPSTLPKPPTLLFHYEGEQSIILESDITDHYIEDNTAVADQIALKPERYTVRGYIGELNNVAPTFLEPVRAAAEKLTNIGAYAPQVSVTAALAYAEAFFLYQTSKNVANAAVSAWKTISNLSTGGQAQTVISSSGIKVGNAQNEQQMAFQQFYGYWRNKNLFTVQTPWAVFQNMAIERIRPTQFDESRMVTEFEITFKMIRVASTIATGGLSRATSFLDGRAAAQASPGVDLGVSSPVSSMSLKGGLSSMGFA